MIRVERDAVGIRLVLGQMLERDHDLQRLAPQIQGKSEEQKAMFLRTVTKVTYSPGYERWANHLIYLEGLQQLGVLPGELLAAEVTGLQVLASSRAEHRYKHPACHACGVPQPSRFQPECMDCGTKYLRRSRTN